MWFLEQRLMLFSIPALLIFSAIIFLLPAPDQYSDMAKVIFVFVATAIIGSQIVFAFMFAKMFAKRSGLIAIVMLMTVIITLLTGSAFAYNLLIYGALGLTLLVMIHSFADTFIEYWVIMGNNKFKTALLMILYAVVINCMFHYFFLLKKFYL